MATTHRTARAMLDRKISHLAETGGKTSQHTTAQCVVVTLISTTAVSIRTLSTGIMIQPAVLWPRRQRRTPQRAIALATEHAGLRLQLVCAAENTLQGADPTLAPLAAPRGSQLRVGRIVAAEKEAPNLSANLV